MSTARRPAFDTITHSPEQTRQLAATLGRMMPRGTVVLLSGEIGAGKTTFAQGFARALKTGDHVQSPTFTIVSEHRGTGTDGDAVRLYHIDLYRLDGDSDLTSVGLDEYLDDPDGVSLIEWPERAGAYLPEDYLLVELTPVADEKRSLRITPYGDVYRDVVDRFRGEVVGGR